MAKPPTRLITASACLYCIRPFTSILPLHARYWIVVAADVVASLDGEEDGGTIADSAMTVRVEVQ
jgi:hypothetical protein